jgi:hypothetical protein
MVDTEHGPLFQDSGPGDGWYSIGAATPPDVSLTAAETADGGVITLDMSYLYQRALERLAAAGKPLPDGITVESLAEWRVEHPDYDPSLPLAGMPIPEGVDVTVEDGKSYGPVPVDYPVTPAPDLDEIQDRDYRLPVLAPDVARPVDRLTMTRADFDRGEVVLSPYAMGGEIEVVAVEPDARCLASTGAPVDAERQCKVHADGSHRCYQGPGHQGAKAPAPVVMARCSHVVPEWATHSCDCGFAWTNVVQVSA